MIFSVLNVLSAVIVANALSEMQCTVEKSTTLSSSSVINTTCIAEFLVFTGELVASPD